MTSMRVQAARAIVSASRSLSGAMTTRAPLRSWPVDEAAEPLDGVEAVGCHAAVADEDAGVLLQVGDRFARDLDVVDAGFPRQPDHLAVDHGLARDGEMEAGGRRVRGVAAVDRGVGLVVAEGNTARIIERPVGRMRAALRGDEAAGQVVAVVALGASRSAAVLRLIMRGARIERAGGDGVVVDDRAAVDAYVHEHSEDDEGEDEEFGGAIAHRWEVYVADGRYDGNIEAQRHGGRGLVGARRVLRDGR